MPVADDNLDGAIQRFCSELEPTGGMVTKWFLVYEGIRDDGTRYLGYSWQEDMKTWDVRGLLHETLDQQLQNQLVDQLMEDDGDA